MKQIARLLKPTRRTSSEDCMLAIMRMIRDGEISPTERVGEASLAAMLGVGLAMTREVLNRLADFGILERVPRSGSFLRKFTLQDFAQIADVRCSLECLAVRLATLGCSDLTLEALREEALAVDSVAVHPVFENPDSQHEVLGFDQDRDFHLHICRASNNDWLLPVMKSQCLLDRCFLMEMQFPPLGGEERSIPRHADIVDAMASRDADEAEDVMRRHILMHKEIRVRMLLGEFVERS